MSDTEIRSELNANIWKVEVSPGDAVAEGDILLVLEAMKVEIPVEAPRAGTVGVLAVAQGQAVVEGQVLLTLGG